MKWLIGAACIAIIAASAFTIGKPWYDTRVAQVQSEKMHRDASDALSEYAKAMPAGHQTVGELCKFADIHPEAFSGEDGIKVANTCRYVGIAMN